MSRRMSSRWGLGFLALLGRGGCGAKTGLLVPDVVLVTDAPRDVPTDAPRQDLCIDVVPDAGVVTVNLLTRPQLSIADVFFVVDRTGSMEEEIDSIRLNLQRSIVPGIASTIGDVQFGVATYGTSPRPLRRPGRRPLHPRDPHRPQPRERAGRGEFHSCGRRRRQPRGDGRDALPGALGEGYSPWIPTASPCGAPGRVGYGCLRPNAQAIFLVIADAPMHNGPDGQFAVRRAAFTTPDAVPDLPPGLRGVARAAHLRRGRGGAAQRARAGHRH